MRHPSGNVHRAGLVGRGPGGVVASVDLRRAAWRSPARASSTSSPSTSASLWTTTPTMRSSESTRPFEKVRVGDFLARPRKPQLPVELTLTRRLRWRQGGSVSGETPPPYCARHARACRAQARAPWSATPGDRLHRHAGEARGEGRAVLAAGRAEPAPVVAVLVRTGVVEPATLVGGGHAVHDISDAARTCSPHCGTTCR